MHGPWVIATVFPKDLNALVSHLMAKTGISDPHEAILRICSGEWDIVPASQILASIDPFWENRQDFAVYDTFTRCVLPAVRDGETADLSGCYFKNLSLGMRGTDILREYCQHNEGQDPLCFTLNQIRSYLQDQWDGEEDGPLLVHSSLYNLFLCRAIGKAVMIVSVIFFEGHWNIQAHPLSHHWSLDNRIHVRRSNEETIVFSAQRQGSEEIY